MENIIWPHSSTSRYLSEEHENTNLKRYMHLFVYSVLFTIANIWEKTPKCPSTDEWIKKMWHIFTMESYSAIKRNKIELFVVRWMDLESVITE